MSLTGYNLDPRACIEGGTCTTWSLVANVESVGANAQECFSTLVKVIENVLIHPESTRYHELRKANGKVRQAIVNCEPCSKLLKRCGFQDKGDKYHLQNNGLRLGEVGRLALALSEYELYVHLGQSLASNAGFELSLPRSASEGKPLSRAGWMLFHSTDVDQGMDYAEMPAGDIRQCQIFAEENCLGGFSIWEGTAYFREAPGVELMSRLVQAQDVTFYGYKATNQSKTELRAFKKAAKNMAPDLGFPFAGTAGRASEKVADADEDEDEDAALQEALHASMMQK
mmetsp:Transcript_74830/g.167902  ORF Transcript_74830/g.167902 Transcript_74830/m.167902 type:complete len:284 (-) Transcript_74830:77-928(-)